MKDQTASSGTVWRSGTVSERKKDHTHKKRPCRSAPAAPANVALRFHKQNEDHRTHWRGVIRFDAVTVDVSGRDLVPEHYEAELQAVDASGDPVETHGQEVSTMAIGADFTVHAGSATVIGKAIRLEAANAVVKKTITGLTTGIEAAVDFYLRKDAPGSSPNVKVEIFDFTAGSTVSQKNVTPDNINPKLAATRSVTPVAGHTYEARVTFLSGTGKPIVQAAQWHDKGDTAIWRHRVPGDADPLRARFNDLPKPKVWYYQARCRAMNRVHGAKCYSAWSAWTTAANPVTGDPIGPPAPDGLVLTFHRNEARKKSPFQAKALWNELPWWMPIDGEPVEGADRYAIKLEVSEDAGASVVDIRRHTVQAKDDDADQTAFFEFPNIRRRRHYRFAVRAIKDDRRGAWSAFSAWKSPKVDIGNGPNAPISVDKTKVKPGVILATWDEPTNPEDVDYYRVRVLCQGNVRETRKTRSNHYKYIIPDADRGTAHSFKVTAIDEDENASLEVDSGSAQDDVDPGGPGGEGFEVGDVRKLAHVSVTNWLSTHPKWLRANGQALSTASYPDLWAEIGYTYGGSGATFNLPDLNGRHSIGVSSLLTVGANDGDTEANRLVVHAHASDSTGASPTADVTYGDIGTGDQPNTPGPDYTQEASGHTHNAGSLGNSTNPATVDKATGGGSAAGPSHGHTITGFTGTRDVTHDHQGHNHSNHGHNHGHNNANHHHGHGHGNHPHPHGHDQKKRPHIAVHYVIKVLV